MEPTRKINRVYNGYFQVDLKTNPDGRTKEIVRATDAVAFLIHDLTNQELILVRQVRDAMIDKVSPSGELMEPTAGRLDCALLLEELIIKEAHEEAGVTVKPEQIIFLNNRRPLATSPGMTDEMLYLAYIPIRNQDIEMKDRVIYGNPDEGEAITRWRFPVHLLDTLRVDDLKLFALIEWFKVNIITKEVTS